MPPPDTPSPTRQLFERITAEIEKVFVGQSELVLGTLVALFSNGHVLIESVPGLGKTLFVRALGRVLGCRFGRIQFTADLMPSDITGAPIFDMKTQEFRFIPGPVFTQLLLADEINRSPAKTHAALLEIMQEYHVTVERVSHAIEPLPGPGHAEPRRIGRHLQPAGGPVGPLHVQARRQLPVERGRGPHPGDARHAGRPGRAALRAEPVTHPREIMEIARRNSNVLIDPRLLNYINALVRLTRQWLHFHMGASPRAGLALVQGARTLAAFRGRDYAVPDDVVELALPALRHRVILSAEAEVEGRTVDELLLEMVRGVEVPRL